MSNENEKINRLAKTITDAADYKYSERCQLAETSLIKAFGTSAAHRIAIDGKVQPLSGWLMDIRIACTDATKKSRHATAINDFHRNYAEIKELMERDFEQ